MHALSKDSFLLKRPSDFTLPFDWFNNLPQVVFDLSLARGLDYYTGVIYEAILQGGQLNYSHSKT